MRARKPALVALCILSGAILLLTGCHDGHSDAVTTEPVTLLDASGSPVERVPETHTAPTGSKEGLEIPQTTLQTTDPATDRYDPPAASGGQEVHRHQYSAVQTAPTCVAQGYTTYTCSCGASYTDGYRDALGHTYGPWVTEIQPTTAAAGRQTRTCSRCGHTESSTLPQLVSTAEFAQDVVALVNAQRRSAGLSPLTELASLDDFAQTRSREIATRFDHVRPDGSNPLSYVLQAGYHTAGENIAEGFSSPEAVVEGWMNSPSHRANILSPDFSYIGVGHCTVDGQDYWVQIFAGA